MVQYNEDNCVEVVPEEQQSPSNESSKPADVLVGDKVHASHY